MGPNADLGSAMVGGGMNTDEDGKKKKKKKKKIEKFELPPFEDFGAEKFNQLGMLMWCSVLLWTTPV